MMHNITSLTSFHAFGAVSTCSTELYRSGILAENCKHYRSTLAKSESQDQVVHTCSLLRGIDMFSVELCQTCFCLPSEKRFTLTGKNFLPREANSFLFWEGDWYAGMHTRNRNGCLTCKKGQKIYQLYLEPLRDFTIQASSRQTD